MKTIVYLLIALGILGLFYSFISVDTHGDGISKSYEVGNFSEVALHGPFDIEVRQGDRPKLEILAPEKAHEKLRVFTTDDRLTVSLPDKLISFEKSIKINLVVVELQKVEINGPVKLASTGTIDVEDLMIKFIGAGDVNLDLRAQKVISEINGVGNFVLTGTTEYHKIDFSGVGNYDAKNLISKHTSVQSDGVGNVEVFASEKFIGNASGIGNVTYFGDPLDVRVDASGIGKVHRD